jgi:rhodanese-related sulfurtransferase
MGINLFANSQGSAPTWQPAPLNRRQGLIRLLSLAPAGVFSATLVACTEAANATDRVSLDTARADHEAGRVALIDIREPVEHATGVAAGAKLLPMSQLKARLSEVPVQPDKPVYLICKTQNRSSATVKALRELGYAHVRFVDGGMSEWARRGWPMVKPSR